MEKPNEAVEKATEERSERPKTLARMNAGRLSTTNLNFSVPAMEGVKEYVQETHGKESWRCAILHKLHNHKVQYFLMSLLFLDVIILFIETFLIGHYPPCKIIERDCLSCCPTSAAAAGGRFLAESTTASVCESGYDTTTGYGSCDEHKWHTVHSIEMVLFGLTITILLTFFIEIHLEMIALGPSVFFRQIFYLFDYIIIVVSTTLELLFFFDHEQLGLSSISGLIVFARIWRFVRIGHGIIEVTTELTHARYEDLMEYAEKLEEEMKKNNLPLPKPPKSLHRKPSEEEGTA
mmetsp:Transcript_16791/g.40932  ORF Transcript_16791/g.40932 Transcript_16791/m.40932 type:complete len:292 (+) Transcript_16791:90-965(+)|eukprot:CAMPEP_0113622932 /NCGR_PEP_ID=MMETSP0017_2-20120614/11774_1 /TAXON_ID=2856 /ORGANISM="Cylindrotheca closterium" /LENGTH=291 /DNA_ID=CAMNT_0000532821 /DNA_START=12 /DNA_END=887 /DNA_ORIENTATION=+ /assembly_acc=CAM_ASM_000147